MTTPTLPSLWGDVLTQLNAFLAWDVVKGTLVLTLGLFLGAMALRQVNKSTH
jgi:hypothetical protein